MNESRKKYCSFSCPFIKLSVIRTLTCNSMPIRTHTNRELKIIRDWFRSLTSRTMNFSIKLNLTLKHSFNIHQVYSCLYTCFKILIISNCLSERDHLNYCPIKMAMFTSLLSHIVASSSIMMPLRIVVS